ncbi:thiamine biosynthesis lipoprotein [Roseovarius nanhaiticus]|uniref:FAD:protein FMN transferase n=1 Tax=Roseovarius nanhaiticus TaxID=573024 RepID=A0A1N7HB78_9RHOB|nr:FAD:protein FMN transferase [Roseovarius nanhaiticus]SEL04945.1 thiamine biosynthesis lipoprotein [Roseovarius nanhaiticus]SIS22139.1 thiamine biosynthesis lipoprotein [Roseovarius nanhaiticus]
MSRLSRRRFLTISAGAAATAAGSFAGSTAAAPEITQWRGMALGARTTLTLAHADADRIAADVARELDRLEDIFSLYKPASALSRLNADGQLDAPPFELLECLSLCGQLHALTGGLFDPTIQPLWSAWARHYSGESGGLDVAHAQALTGWQNVSFGSGFVRLKRPGMALTLNGIAQGVIADRIAAMLRAEGLTNIMVDTGELAAIGGHPHGGDWPVTLRSGGQTHLRDMAMATSAPRGTCFDAAQTAGHILNPVTGQPADTPWRQISISGPSAAMTDGLTTAACLMDRTTIQAAVRTLGLRLVHLS